MTGFSNDTIGEIDAVWGEACEMARGRAQIADAQAAQAWRDYDGRCGSKVAAMLASRRAERAHATLAALLDVG